MIALPAPVALLPHKGDAVLLDEIRNIDELRLEAGLVVRPGTAFSDDAGCLPGWVGPEIMAQAIAALSGHRSLTIDGRPAAIGLLLGVKVLRNVGARVPPGRRARGRGDRVVGGRGGAGGVRLTGSTGPDM